MELQNNIEQHFAHIRKLFNELIRSNTTSFKEIAGKKDITGVYIIYSPENEILYIGSTNRFNIRFGTDLKHESTHTLIRKFLKQELFAERKLAVEYICTRCIFRIQVCENKREAEALESFAIWVLSPRYNK